MSNLKFALRQFAKSPGFAITVILTISLGIGANTAIFTLVHGILLKSLPVNNPATLYRIGDLDDCCVNGGFINDNGDFDLFSYDLYRHLQDTTPEFEQLAAFQSGQNMMNVRVGNNAAKAERTEYVTGNYFSTFGIGAYTGRMFQPLPLSLSLATPPGNRPMPRTPMSSAQRSSSKAIRLRSSASLHPDSSATVLTAILPLSGSPSTPSLCLKARLRS